MTRLRNLGLAAVVVSASVALVFAHDGHDHEATNKPKSSPNRDSNGGRALQPPTVPDSFSPRIPIPPDRLPFQIDGDQLRRPATECEAGQCPLTRPSSPPVDDRRRLDPRVVSIRLEFAAELLADDLSFELRGACGASNVLRDADQLIEQTRHLRSSFGADGKLDGIRAAVMTFQRIERSLDGYRVDALTGRDFELTGRLLAELATQMRKTQRTPVGGPAPARAPRQVPLTPPRLPSLPAPVADTPRNAPIPDDMKGIATLSAAEQAAALAQRTCPVTNELLGSHGTPLKVTIRGKDIFVCCRGCVADLKANPANYLGR